MKLIRVIIIILFLTCIAAYFSIWYINNNIKLENANDVMSENISIVDEKIDQKEEIQTNEQVKENEVKTDNEREDGKNIVNSNKTQTTNTNNSKYYIKVNYSQNVVTVYEKDNTGKYTIPVKAMICSTGTATPRSGVYTIKSRWEWLGLFGDVYGHYVTQIVGNILFHSVPYLKKAPDSLEYWEYDKLGSSASLGCIRLKVIDAKWIYDNISSGTQVEFYSSSNPGPLGKPTAQKISDNIECRNWDPTDPNISNPWSIKETVPDEETSEVPTAPEITIPSESEKEEQDVEIYEEPTEDKLKDIDL